MNKRIMIILGLAALVNVPSGLLSFAEAAQKPNVIILISDQHKKAASGCYGDELVITPNIDALAERGVRFENCYTPAPVCAPARAALMTGMYPHENEAIYHKAPAVVDGKEKRFGSGYLRETGYTEGVVTLAEVFRKNGYVTAAPGKMHVHGELQKGIDPAHPKGNDLGFDETSVRYYTYFPGGHYSDEVGTDTFQRYRQIEKYGKKSPMGKGLDPLNGNYQSAIVENDEDNFDMVVARKAVEFLNARGKDGKNFFIHVGFEKPHMPFTTTQKYLDMYDPDDFKFPETVDAWYGKGKFPWVESWVHNATPQRAPEKARNIMAAYYACITQMDDMVGRVIDSLKENGLYENTIVIYTTDHGEHLFEHGMRGKHNMYEASANIPFIIAYPDVLPQNTVNESMISLIDVMPTLCDALGWKVPETATGKSFLDIAQKKVHDKDHPVYTEYRNGGEYEAFPGQKDVPSRMVRKNDYKFVYTHGVIGQLYHVARDKNEMNNLVMNPEYRQMSNDWCFQALADWRFDRYYPLVASADGSTLKWKEYDLPARYSVYFSAAGDHTKAKAVAVEITGTRFETKQRGSYWVMAHPELTRTSAHFKHTPVLVEKHTFELPISDAVTF